jgi:hypothetical protein
MENGMSTPALDLDERIAAAFADCAKSGDVADLIAEAEASAVSSAEAADRARTRALDPALSATEVAAARRSMEDGAFARDRMQEAVVRLGERLRDVRRQEEQARRRTAYDAALAERDVLAAELATLYPDVAEQLADLVARIAANDAVIERINLKSLPDGAKWLDGTELLARGLRGFNDGTATIPRITQHMRLPAFKYSGLEPYSWPPVRG